MIRNRTSAVLARMEEHGHRSPKETQSVLPERSSESSGEDVLHSASFFRAACEACAGNPMGPEMETAARPANPTSKYRTPWRRCVVACLQAWELHLCLCCSIQNTSELHGVLLLNKGKSMQVSSRGRGGGGAGPSWLEAWPWPELAWSPASAPRMRRENRRASLLGVAGAATRPA